MGVLFHIGRDGAIGSLDPQFFSARFLDQLPHIPQTDREKFDQSGGIGLLPGIVLFLRAPFDESRPARQGGELEREVVLPEFRRNGQGFETVQDRVLGMLGQGHELCTTLRDVADRPFFCG